MFIPAHRENILCMFNVVLMFVIHHPFSLDTKKICGNLIDFEIKDKKRNNLRKHCAEMIDKKAEQNFKVSQMSVFQ